MEGAVVHPREPQADGRGAGRLDAPLHFKFVAAIDAARREWALVGVGFAEGLRPVVVGGLVDLVGTHVKETGSRGGCGSGHGQRALDVHEAGGFGMFLAVGGRTDSGRMDHGGGAQGGNDALAGGGRGDVHLGVAGCANFELQLFAQIPDETTAQEAAPACDQDGGGKGRCMGMFQGMVHGAE